MTAKKKTSPPKVKHDENKLHWPKIELELNPQGYGNSTIKVNDQVIGLVQKIKVEMDADTHIPVVTIQLVGSVFIKGKGYLRMEKPVDQKETI